MAASERTYESVLKDIKEYPERHYHNFDELFACCSINGAYEPSLANAHALYVNWEGKRTSRCDVVSGHCGCGGVH